MFVGINLINRIYQLTSPRNINVKYEDVHQNDGLIVRPKYISICHADRRYYWGRRPHEILMKKLPMSLIHECCGEVLKDYKSIYEPGTKVVLIPNIPPKNLKSDIFENYQKGAKFRSSGVDGFMQELVPIEHDRVVPFLFDEKYEYVFSITELLSVCVHAVNRFLSISHKYRERIAIFGDGSVGFLTSLVISNMIPSSKILVIGHHEEKLACFSFAYETFTYIPNSLEFDHAFECTGGNGSIKAIDSIIEHINPQGSVILMGVSEEKVPINTRNILEKGLTFVGASRSGFDDFKKAVSIIEKTDFNKKIRNIITMGEDINSIDDIHKAFELIVPFKSVFKWNI